MRRNQWADLLLLLAVLVSGAGGQEWTRFRGPNGRGQGDAGQLPAQWTDTDIRWRTALPGEGHSSPVLWGETVFVTTWDPAQGLGLVVALNGATGGILWQQSYPLGQSRLHSDNSYAASTPAVNRENLFVSWPDGDRLVLAALGHDGKKKWTRDFGKVFGRHGLGGSPVLYEDLIILTQEHWEQNSDGQQSRWLGVDQEDGSIRWQLNRTSRVISYGTPALFTDTTGRDQLIFSSQAHGITAIDPAKGEVLWEISDCFADRTVSSPLVAGDLIVASSGQGGGGKTLMVVRPGQSNRPPEILHRIENRQVPYVPTPIAVGGRLYLFHDGGGISCWDAEAGRSIWAESIKGRFYGSPVAVGDRIYCVTMKGEVVVIQAGDEYRLLGVNPLKEACHTTPAVANDHLYVRTLTSLVCVSGGS